MLAEDGTAKLLDFGLAKLGDELVGPPVVSVATRIPNQPSSQGRLKAASAPTIEAPSLEECLAPRSSPNRQAAGSSEAMGALDTTPQPTSGKLPADLGRAQTMPGMVSSDRYPALHSESPSLTMAGSVMGTPAYMPPEAWRGEMASPRSDVYSLGALFYELCCGHPPHDYNNAEQLREAAQEQDVLPLHEVAPSVDRRFAAIVDCCLRRRPLERYESGEELQRALETLAAALVAPSANSVMRQMLRRRWPAVVLVATLLLLPTLALMMQFYQNRVEQKRSASMLKNRRSIAVLGLKGLAGDANQAGFAAAFSELLGSELAIGERLRRVPPENVARMKSDLKLPVAEAYSPEQLSRIHQQLGVDLLVSGTYEQEAAKNHANRLRIRIAVQEVQGGGVLAATEVRGSPSELFELLTQTGMELRRQLRVGQLSSEQVAALRAGHPTTPEVAQLYAEGRELLRRFDAAAARKLLERAIAREPEFPLVHLAMAEVYTALGYDEKAKSEAKRAFELSVNLPREERHLIEGRYREVSKEWGRAIAIYRELLTFFPESLDYGLALANAQLSAGQPEPARVTARKLRQLRAPANQDPRLDIVEARANADAGDQQVAYQLLMQAARQGEAIGAPQLVAKARLEAAYTLSNLGQPDQALENASLAEPLFVAAGDRGAAADALMAMGGAYLSRGELARSLKVNQDALTLLMEIENTALTAANLCNVALLLIKKGDLELARARAEGGLVLSRQIGLLESTGAGYIAIGVIFMLQGELDLAQHNFQEAASIFHELGDPRMVPWADWNIAQVIMLRGDLATARQKHQEALAMREQHGLKGFAAESRVALASIALDEGRFSDAEALARAASDEFAQEHQADQEAGAQALLSEALGRQAKRPEAQQSLVRAQALAANYENLSIRLLVRRYGASLVQILFNDKTTRAELDTAERDLSEVIAVSSTAGFTIEAMEAKLALARVKLERGKLDEAMALLATLLNEAQRNGIGLIANKVNQVKIAHKIK